MENKTCAHFLVILLWIIEACTIILLHTCGIYLLVTERRHKIQHIILIQLSCLEILNIIWDLFFYKQTVLNTDALSEVNRTGTLIIWIGIFLTVLTLTLDRLLAVRLGILYNIHVTTKRTCIVLMIIWFIALMHVFNYFNFDEKRQNILFVTWECVLLVFLVSSYLYIFIKLSQLQRRTNSSTSLNQRQLNYRIPLLIVLSLICFVFLLDILMVMGVAYSTWFSLVYQFNFLADACIYIFGTRCIRKRVSAFWYQTSAQEINTITL